MNDKLLIIDGRLAAFSTAVWGVLKVEDDKVVLDKVKAFNTARLMLNSGANYFRVLRRGIWSIVKPYDWETPGYWQTLREYFAILHHPTQGTWTAPGARIIYEIIDGCSEGWYLSDYAKARKLYQAAFANLGDLDYVDFGVGNEMNSDQDTAFVAAVSYPEFKKAKRIPFSYGATYKSGKRYIENQKKAAAEAWNPPKDTEAGIWDVGDAVAGQIYRGVHKVKDKDSTQLTETMYYWIRDPAKNADHPIPIIWSVDGVKDGKSDCDYYVAPDGTIGDTRPSVAEWRSAIKAVLDYARKFTLASGQVKFGFEWIGKAVNDDACSAKGILAISQEYFVKWGKYPENLGKYPNDWVEPGPPPPPQPPEPPMPPPEPQKSFWQKLWDWIKGLFS